MCYCAPFIDSNIDTARAKGVNILGCCGDSNHKSGFHVAANKLPSTDYSIRHSGKPADPNEACAGDFGMNTPWARRWLAYVVSEARAGRLPGVVEIIGSLDGVNVLYWAAWYDWKAKAYTGAGHKT